MGAVSVIAAAVSYRPLKNLYHITTLAYLNGRYGAEGNRLLEPQEMYNLLETGGIGEAVDLLRNMGYRVEVEPSADSFDIGRGTFGIYSGALKEMEMKAPKRLRKVLSILEEETFYRNISSALLYLKRKEEGVVGRAPLLPTRRMTKHDIEKIERMAGLEEFYEYYSGEDVRDVEELLKELKKPLEEGDYERVMYLSERFYYKRFYEELKSFDTFYRRALEDYWKWKVDRLNLKTALAYSLRGEPERVEKIVEGLTGRIKSWKISQIAFSSGRDFKEELLSTPYGDLIRRASLEGEVEREPFMFERFLDLLEMHMAEEIYVKNVLTLGTILRYLILRWLEAKNARTALLGILRGVPRETVLKNMVLRGG